MLHRFFTAEANPSVFALPLATGTKIPLDLRLQIHLLEWLPSLRLRIILQIQKAATTEQTLATLLCLRIALQVQKSRDLFCHWRSKGMEERFDGIITGGGRRFVCECLLIDWKALENGELMIGDADNENRCVYLEDHNLSALSKWQSLEYPDPNASSGHLQRPCAPPLDHEPHNQKRPNGSNQNCHTLN